MSSYMPADRKGAAIALMMLQACAYSHYAYVGGGASKPTSDYVPAAYVPSGEGVVVLPPPTSATAGGVALEGEASVNIAGGSGTCTGDDGAADDTVGAAGGSCGSCGGGSCPAPSDSEQAPTGPAAVYAALDQLQPFPVSGRSMFTIPGAGVVAQGEVVQIVPNGDGLEAELSITLRPNSGGVRPATHFVVVVDRSSSMQAHWSFVTDAVQQLGRSLRNDDQLTVITYDQSARYVAHAVAGAQAGAIQIDAGLQRPDRFLAGSNVEAGLRMALAETASTKPLQVWLISDGAPQGGAATPESLARVVASAPMESPFQLNVVAFGRNPDAEVLNAIANAGAGTVVSAPSGLELATVVANVAHDLENIAAWNIRLDVDAGLPTTWSVGATHGGRAYQDGNALRVLVPQLAVGDEVTLQARMVVPSLADASSVSGHGELSFQSAQGPQELESSWTLGAEAMRLMWQGELNDLTERALIQAADAFAATNNEAATTACSREVDGASTQATAVVGDSRTGAAFVHGHTEALQALQTALSHLGSITWAERRALAQALRDRAALFAQH